MPILAEMVDESDLRSIAADLMSEFESDKNSRSDWEKTYTEGLDLLGFKYDDRARPFSGASGVTHPLLAEAVTQFQAQAYKELLPAGGPVRTVVVWTRDAGHSTAGGACQGIYELPSHGSDGGI